MIRRLPLPTSRAARVWLASLLSLACGAGAEPSAPPPVTALPDLDLVRIEAGAFVRGGSYGESAYGPEYDARDHRVRLTRAFWIGRTEVTQRLWSAVQGGASPSALGGPAHPVESVSWYDAIAFCNALSERAGLRPAYRIEEDPEGGDTLVWDRDADGYRLPTEAEWEYAARAGEDKPFSSSNDAEEAGWNALNADDETHEVARKKPNAWGLYDASGNVSEWVFDGYRERPPAGDDPFVAEGTPERVLRGGSFTDHPDLHPSSLLVVFHRAGLEPTARRSQLGLRLARSTPPAAAARRACDRADLAKLDSAGLRLARNEVFARRGRPFESSDLRAYFAAQPWYRADPAYSDARLDAEDRRCLEQIRREEASRAATP